MIDLSPAQNRTVAAGITVAAFSLLVAFMAVLGWGVLAFLSFASPALTPVILGLFLAMLFKPYFEWYRARVRNPSLALLLMGISVLAPLALLVWFGGAFAADQTTHLFKAAPTVVERASAWANACFPAAQGKLAQFGAPPDSPLIVFLADPARFSNEMMSLLGAQYGGAAMKAGVGFLRYAQNLGTFLITLIFLVYFLMRPAMTGEDIVRQLPFLKNDSKTFVAKQVNTFVDILVSFFQRQVVICLLEGVLYGAGFLVVGLPYGFVIGFLLGTLNLVPLLGTVVCLPLALPIAYFGDGGSALRLAGVLAVWLTGQLLDGYLITPKIQGKKTGLGYAGVIFSFIFWGVVFHSMLGLLLAIPLSAFCVVLWNALKERIRGIV